MTKNQKAEAIIQVLMNQEFADWYNKGAFDAWITGDYKPGTKQMYTQAEIEAETIKMFNLKDDE